MDFNKKFKDQVALITGAGSGLGSALAFALGKQGAKLILGDVNQIALQKVVADLTALDIQVAFNVCDVSQNTDQVALVQLALDTWGRLDIAVNNAGICPPMHSFHEISEADFDFAMNVNTKGVFLGMKHQLSAMVKSELSGVILNVSSVAGLGAAPKLASYSASKHAVIGLTKTAAVEYAKKNIRINAICPFYTQTPLVTESQLFDKIEFLNNSSPMKRLATSDEIIDVMLMLCSPQNTYMTGQAIAVDGGVTAL